MPEKTEGVKIVGRVNAKNEYKGENKTSYTLDIACLGARSMIPVSVDGDLYHKINVGETFARMLGVSINKYGTRFIAQ